MQLETEERSERQGAELGSEAWVEAAAVNRSRRAMGLGVNMVATAGGWGIAVC